MSSILISDFTDNVAGINIEFRRFFMLWEGNFWNIFMLNSLGRADILLIGSV